MTKLLDRTEVPAPTRRRRVLGRLGWVLGVAVGVVALFALVAWLLPPSRLEGALLGPGGFAIAFLVGLIGAFSPCVLPLLPGYLSFVSGLSGEELEESVSRRRVVTGTSLFVLGFATVFTALGAAASAAGALLLDNLEVVNRIAGAVVIVMGLAFLAPSLLKVLEVERRPLMGRVKPGLAGAFPLGLAFAVGWTPCVGPGLAVMLSLGYREASVGRGALLLLFFSLGFGFWFVVAALGVRRALAASETLRRHARRLQVAGGVFLLAIGGLLVTDAWETLMAPLRRLIVNFVPPV